MDIKEEENMQINNVNGLKIAICQMPVVPGRPDVNAEYAIERIKEAEKQQADIIVFGEMIISGYLIGDEYEDDWFVADIRRHNEKIREATRGLKIAVAFGSLFSDTTKRNNDGRIRKFNAGLVAQNGRWITTSKCLQPDYRIFDDDRHFFSLRKTAQELGVKPEKLIEPILFNARDGRSIIAGFMLCEDMWSDDYDISPSQILVDKGARILFNLSASPWTWQKNQKRHRVIKSLNCGVPFVYVNITGCQNNGKNIVTFDGSSTVYNVEGDIVFEVPPYFAGTMDYVVDDKDKSLLRKELDDTTQLYQAIRCGIATMSSGFEKVVIGLSGGIDSAVVASLFVDILGKERVILVNMPSKYNSLKTRGIADRLAVNMVPLENYLVIPIQDSVDLMAKKTNTLPGTLSYENLQARERMQILATLAQNYHGGFTANWNKVEAAFGYGTLYADIAGFLAPLGDLVKREVYQLGRFMNLNIFRREIIPKECFKQKPSAELNINQTDPFDYGNLIERGYHDEMVRAFVEFRKNPEWFLDCYRQGVLEMELKLREGKLSELFPTSRDFILDLAKRWHSFKRSYFKRVQTCPLIIVSKRAFGYDLRESMLPAYFTEEYRKQVIFSY
jgi:NAD+ synthase (glutamine-hydrolysing)